MTWAAAPSNSANRYLPIQVRATSDPGITTDAVANAPVGAGSVLGFWVSLVTAPGSGKSRRLQIVKNGSANGTFDVTISDTNTSAFVTGSSLSFAAGDTISVLHTPSGTPAASDVRFAIEFLPDVTDYFCYPCLWVRGANETNASRYGPMLSPWSGNGLSSDTPLNETVIPFNGTIREFRMLLGTPPGSGKSWDFKMFINGAEVGSALNIADSATTGSQTGLSVSVSAGDKLTWLIKAKNGTAAGTKMAYCFVLQPTTANQYFIGGTNDDSPADAVRYNEWHLDRGSVFQGTESSSQFSFPVDATLYALYVLIATTPGSGKSRTINTRIGGNPGNLSVALNNVTSGNDTGHTDSVSAGALVDISMTPAGTPAANAAWSWGLCVVNGVDYSASPVGPLIGGKLTKSILLRGGRLVP